MESVGGANFRDEYYFVAPTPGARPPKTAGSALGSGAARPRNADRDVITGTAAECGAGFGSLAHGVVLLGILPSFAFLDRWGQVFLYFFGSLFTVASVFQLPSSVPMLSCICSPATFPFTINLIGLPCHSVGTVNEMLSPSSLPSMIGCSLPSMLSMVPVTAALTDFNVKTTSPPPCMGPVHFPVVSAANRSEGGRRAKANVNVQREIRIVPPDQYAFRNWSAFARHLPNVPSASLRQAVKTHPCGKSFQTTDKRQRVTHPADRGWTDHPLTITVD